MQLECVSCHNLGLVGRVAKAGNAILCRACARAVLSSDLSRWLDSGIIADIELSKPTTVKQASSLELSPKTARLLRMLEAAEVKWIVVADRAPAERLCRQCQCRCKWAEYESNDGLCTSCAIQARYATLMTPLERSTLARMHSGCAICGRRDGRLSPRESNDRIMAGVCSMCAMEGDIAKVRSALSVRMKAYTLSHQPPLLPHIATAINNTSIDGWRNRNAYTKVTCPVCGWWQPVRESHYSLMSEWISLLERTVAQCKHTRCADCRMAELGSAEYYLYRRDGVADCFMCRACANRRFSREDAKHRKNGTIPSLEAVDGVWTLIVDRSPAKRVCAVCHRMLEWDMVDSSRVCKDCAINKAVATTLCEYQHQIETWLSSRPSPLLDDVASSLRSAKATCTILLVDGHWEAPPLPPLISVSRKCSVSYCSSQVAYTLSSTDTASIAAFGEQVNASHKKCNDEHHEPCQCLTMYCHCHWSEHRGSRWWK